MTSQDIKQIIFLLEGDLQRNKQAQEDLIKEISDLKSLCEKAEKVELTSK